MTRGGLATPWRQQRQRHGHRGPAGIRPEPRMQGHGNDCVRVR